MVIFPNIPKRSRQQTSSLLLESVLGGVSSPSEARWHPPDNDWRCSGDLASSRQQVGQHQASLQCDRLPPTSSSLQLRLVNIKPACSAIVSLQLHHLCNSGWSKIRGVTKKTLLFRRLLKFSTFSLEKELNSFRPLRAPEQKSCRERTSIFFAKGLASHRNSKTNFHFFWQGFCHIQYFYLAKSLPKK